MRAKWHGRPYHDVTTGKWLLTFETVELPDIFDKTRDKDLNLEIKQHRNHRSKDANALLWECIGRLAMALRADKWDIYLLMLKRYGQYTYIVVPPNAVEMVARQWRECEVIGDININGRDGVQMLCYYGSSTYDTKQFSVLLDGVISEMKEIGLTAPTSEDMRRSIEEWEKQSQ
jgi:hypothetical protein